MVNIRLNLDCPICKYKLLENDVDYYGSSIIYYNLSCPKCLFQEVFDVGSIAVNLKLRGGFFSFSYSQSDEEMAALVEMAIRIAQKEMKK